MIRALITLSLIVATTLTCIAADEQPPSVPHQADVRRYERIDPVFKSKEMSKADGDELLAALDDGRAVEPWGKHFPPSPPGPLICFFGSQRLSLKIGLADGKTYSLGFSAAGDLAYLQDMPYDVNAAAQARIAPVLKRMEDALLKEVASAPRPFIYQLGTLDDHGTLSGVARVIYGDARKWKQIYAANRDRIKNPDIIGPAMKLTIPKIE